MLDDARSTLETLSYEEQDAYDNLPESIQYSERGQAMYDNASEMQDATSSIEEIISNLQSLIEK